MVSKQMSQSQPVSSWNGTSSGATNVLLFIVVGGVGQCGQIRLHTALVWT